MKTLFNAAAAFIRIETDIMVAMYNSISREGGVIPRLIKEVRQGLEESDLKSAMGDLITRGMHAQQAAQKAPWIRETKDEVKLLKKSFRKLGELQEQEAPTAQA
jgi:hypothetical protein